MLKTPKGQNKTKQIGNKVMEKIQQIHMNKIIWAHFLIKDGIRGDRILKEETL